MKEDALIGVLGSCGVIIVPSEESHDPINRELNILVYGLVTNGFEEKLSVEVVYFWVVMQSVIQLHHTIMNWYSQSWGRLFSDLLGWKLQRSKVLPSAVVFKQFEGWHTTSIILEGCLVQGTNEESHFTIDGGHLILSDLEVVFDHLGVGTIVVWFESCLNPILHGGSRGQTMVCIVPHGQSFFGGNRGEHCSSLRVIFQE